MLKTYINGLPCTKFILITDYLEHRGDNILDYVVQNHVDRGVKVQYFTFRNTPDKILNKYKNNRNLNVHDFVSNQLNWVESDCKSFESVTSDLRNGDFVIIDSLADVILLYGASETCKVLNNLKNSKGAAQIITILHADLLLDINELKYYFEHLSTLSIELLPNFTNSMNRLRYSYKKSAGKIINQLEQYKFEGNNFVCEKIPTDNEQILKIVSDQVNPENISTFRIGLNENEKISREKLVLPYLPTYELDEVTEEGKISYTFEDIDDWDEEDPDDDLDI